MPDYVFRSRDGQVKRIYSPKDLSKEEMEEVGYQLFDLHSRHYKCMPGEGHCA